MTLLAGISMNLSLVINSTIAGIAAAMLMTYRFSWNVEIAAMTDFSSQLKR
jgi:hypothetical protein